MTPCTNSISAPTMVGFAALVAFAHAGSVVPPVKCELRFPKTCVAAVSPSQSPPHFSVTYITTAGNFTVDVNRDWAPMFADQFWLLSRVQYHIGAPFYRVDYLSKQQNFVVQFGYRADNTMVDQIWDQDMTDNSTWSVHPPGNVRGTVAYSMGAGTPGRENCTNPEYCAIGFSTNIYVNYGNNSRLDASGFSIFGTISNTGMEVVDRLYAGYGEVADLCSSNDPFTNDTDPYCKGHGKNCTGVEVDNVTTISGGTYLKTHFPKLDKVVDLLTTL
eukprot:m.52556 g.52556  ORF g.52556 m.52556 type:complete len:274 (+) comp21628_c0_seq1:114-935(+)